MGLSDLPLASGKEHVKAFERLGWTPRHGKGSHVVLTKPGHTAHLCIPIHPEVSRALIAKQLALAGIAVADYVAAFARKGRR